MIYDWKLLKIGSCQHPEFMTIKGGGLTCKDFPALVGLLIHENYGPIIFDTGYDSAFLEATKPFPERLYRIATPIQYDESQSIVNALEKYKFTPNDIKAIIISHFHGDHIAGLRNFPLAKIFCAKEGLKQTKIGNRFSRTKLGILSDLIPPRIENRAKFYEDFEKIALPNEFAPFLWGVDLLGDNSLLAVELEGHCKGHWGLIARTKDKPIFFIGDAAWSMKAVDENIPPPNLTIGLLGNVSGYKNTLNKLSILRNNSRDRLEIIPSHCVETYGKWGH